MLVVQGLPTEQASVCTFTYSKFATLRILKFASSFFIASRVYTREWSASVLTFSGLG